MKNQIVNKIYRVVVYLRLSVDDGDNRESDSISTRGYWLGITLRESRSLSS